jgi:hypothetical protein
MKLDYAQALLKKDILNYGSIALGAVLIFALGFFYKGHIESSLEEIEQQQRMLSSQISTIQQDITTLTQSSGLFDSIRSDRMPTVEGYDNTAARIRAMRPVIEELKSKLTFANLDVTLAGVQPLPVSTASQFKVIEGKMDIALAAPSDELVFTFLQSLIERIPGYIVIEKFELRKTKSINEQLIRTIIEEKKPPTLVDGKVTCVWYSLKGEPIKGKANSALKELANEKPKDASKPAEKPATGATP